MDTSTKYLLVEEKNNDLIFQDLSESESDNEDLTCFFDEEESDCSLPPILEESSYASDEEEKEPEQQQQTICSERRVTFNILTTYERVFLIGIRTQQLSNGGIPMIDISRIKGEVTAYKVAVAELEQKVIPFKIKRKLPNGNVEIWDLDELIIL